MAKVLCTGWDKNLLDMRTMLLEAAGHEVRQARSQKEVASECAQRQFDVAVIGQTVSDRMKRLAAAMVRESCRGIRILELYQPHLGKAVEDADAWLFPQTFPMTLRYTSANWWASQ